MAVSDDEKNADNRISRSNARESTPRGTSFNVYSHSW